MKRRIERLALLLYVKFHLGERSLPGGAQVRRDLERLHPGEDKEAIYRNYCVDKLTVSFLILGLGVLLGIAVYLAGHSGGHVLDGGEVVRDSYEEGDSVLSLEGIFDDGERVLMELSVSARVYTEGELKDLWGELLMELPTRIQGENSSCDEIWTDLELLEEYEGYPFLLEWKSDTPEVIASDGSVSEVEEATSVVLTVIAEYRGQEWEAELPVKVLPPNLSDEERLRRELLTAVREAEEADLTQESFLLPDMLEGKKISWKEQVFPTALVLVAMSIAVAFLIFFLKDYDLHTLAIKRRETQRQAYPELVQRLALYLGAGLTMRSAFTRVCEEYERRCSGGGERHPAYEELLYTAREIRAGVSEAVAYEHMGKRIGAKEYIRLATLMSQNLRKGSNALAVQLRTEAEESFARQLQDARKLGEEAVTKLLLPMVLLLAVVMVMILLPAFSSAGI